MVIADPVVGDLPVDTIGRVNHLEGRQAGPPALGVLFRCDEAGAVEVAVTFEFVREKIRATVKDPKTEKDTHSAQLKKVKGMIAKKYPKLKVETRLMGLDGKVEPV